MREKMTAYIALGGNLGDVAANFSSACAAIGALPDTRINARSSLYRTRPWGLTDQPEFLNACLAVETSLAPEDLLQKLLKIERAHGRDRLRTVRWGPRPLDIDILSYGNAQIRSETLTLPHPQLFNRAFVLLPLSEIAGDAVIEGRIVSEQIPFVETGGITRLAGTY